MIDSASEPRRVTGSFIVSEESGGGATAQAVDDIIAFLLTDI